MNIYVAGDGPAALVAGFTVKKQLPESQVTIAGTNRAEDRTVPPAILTNPVVADFSVGDNDIQAVIDAASLMREGVKVYRHKAGEPAVEQLAIPGLAYTFANADALRTALLPLARDAGCVIGENCSANDAAAADLVLVSDTAAATALGLATGNIAHDDAAKSMVISAQCPDAELSFAFAGTEFGLFHAILIPEPAGRCSVVLETAAQTLRKSCLENASAVELRDFCTKTFPDLMHKTVLPKVEQGWQSGSDFHTDKRVSDMSVRYGSAAAFVHHSIGLQLRHDLEDAISLAAAIVESGKTGTLLNGALVAWQDASNARTASYRRAAEASAQWLSEAGRYFDLPIEQFAFACATRSFRMGYKRVQAAAPDFVRNLDGLVAGSMRGAGNDPPPPMFTPYAMRDLDLPNRMVFSPMCMYSATDGTPDDFHAVHLGARAVGGFGLVIAEMTNVTPQGRMTPGCAGMYASEHVPAWKKITDYTHKHTQSKIGIQLAHAGRKGSIGRSWEKYDPVKGEDMWEVIAPSAIPFTPDRPVPREMTKADIQATVDAFAKAASMSVEAGFDMIELHMAHGYLISEFISPLANRRGDAYGGSLQNRMRFPLEVFEAVRAVLPDGMPVAARISANDFDLEGVTPRDSIDISSILHQAGVDIIAVSTAGVTSARRPAASQRLYQLSLCEAIRHEAKTPAMAIGGLVSHTDCNMIIASGRADLCVMARGAMNDPYFPHHSANEQGFRFDWPLPYARADETVIRPS